MRVWKFIRYRVSLFQRGEVEVAGVERFVLSTLLTLFCAVIFSLLYWTVARPVLTVWTSFRLAFADFGL